MELVNRTLLVSLCLLTVVGMSVVSGIAVAADLPQACKESGKELEKIQQSVNSGSSYTPPAVSSPEAKKLNQIYTRCYYMLLELKKMKSELH